MSSGETNNKDIEGRSMLSLTSGTAIYKSFLLLDERTRSRICLAALASLPVAVAGGLSEGMLRAGAVEVVDACCGRLMAAVRAASVG